MKETIEIPDGYKLVKSTDANGLPVYSMKKKDDITKRIKSIGDVYRIIGELDDGIPKIEYDSKESRLSDLMNAVDEFSRRLDIPYSIFIRAKAEMIAKAYRNGWTLPEKLDGVNLKKIYAPHYNLKTKKVEVSHIRTGIVGCPLELCVPDKKACKHMVKMFYNEFYDYFTC